VLAVLTSAVYRDLAIPQVWARELDEDRYGARCPLWTREEIVYVYV
jgi:hypothetical protein